MIFLILLVQFIGFSKEIKAEELKVYYFHRPPYYEKTPQGPGGFLMNISKLIFEKAEIKVTYEEMPPKRILETLKKPKPACSVGWFKTPQRETFLQFSKPIYISISSVIVARKEENIEPVDIKKLRKLFSLSPGRIGIICSFSYGTHIDLIIKELDETCSTTNVINLFKMTAGRRLAFVLSFPEEAGYILKNYEDLGKKLTMIPVEGISQNFIRHIVCSKATPATIMERLNSEIQKRLWWLDR